MRRAALLAAFLFAATGALADWPESMGDRAVWDGAYDPRTGERFIPIELIVPYAWDGGRVFPMRPVRFTDVSGDVWSGPVEDGNVLSEGKFPAYVRERRDRVDGYVVQRFALRKEGDGLGRAYDSRFGGIVCSGEIKFPVGLWKEGEVRRNEFFCIGPSGRPTRRVNTIVIEKIDFPCRGVDHCLQIRWLHEVEGRSGPTDHRRYVFAPGLGEIAHDRLP